MHLHRSLLIAALALGAACGSSQPSAPARTAASSPEALPANVAESEPETWLPPECRAKVPAGGDEVMWAVRVGITTYKSTIHVAGDRVIVATNGADPKSVDDACDGVYVLDARTGALRRFLPVPGEGERDANGVAFAPGEEALYLGTDQGVLYKLDGGGDVVWKKELAGHVEAAPVLADVSGDGTLDVAVGVEEENFYVFDGKSGEELHRVVTARGDYGQHGFLATAAAADVTGDGHADVFAAGRDYQLTAIDGKSGGALWTGRSGSALHSAPILVDEDGDGDLELIYAAAYSTVRSVDAKSGAPRWRKDLTHPGGGIEGLFAPLTWYPELSCALVGTAWWGSDEGLYCVGAGGVKWRSSVAEKNVTSGAVVGDVDGKAGAEVVFGTESGRLLALEKSGHKVWTFDAGAPIECSPTLADLDGDGTLEVLVASTDGVLRAVKTRGAAPPVLGYYRGDSTNAGVMGSGSRVK